MPFALVTALTVTACTPAAPRPPAPPPVSEVVIPADRIVAGSQRGRTLAALLVGDAASRVEVELAHMPGILYRISTPGSSGLEPRVTKLRGLVRLDLRPADGNGPDIVRVVLNRAVRWDVRLPKGAGEQRLDLSGGRITRLDLGSSGLVELRLPRPRGTLPVILRGGVGTVSVTAPEDVPMRITLHEGAGRVVTPWTANNGTAPGETLVAPGWSGTPDRYAMTLRGGAGSVTVRTRGAER